MRGNASRASSQGIMEGLTAYLKFSIFPVLIEDDCSFVSWGGGCAVNHFFSLQVLHGLLAYLRTIF